MINRFIVVSFSLFLLSGCVLYPTTRTYFEPNEADGTLTKSRSCGYHKAALDSLERMVDSVEVGVTPQYRENKELLVILSFYYNDGSVDVSPNEISITSNNGKKIFPKNVTTKSYAMDASHPNRLWANITYPVLSENLDRLSINFSEAALKINGVRINVKPFRFKKISKPDIYYSSINC